MRVSGFGVWCRCACAGDVAFWGGAGCALHININACTREWRDVTGITELRNRA